MDKSLLNDCICQDLANTHFGDPPSAKNSRHSPRAGYFQQSLVQSILVALALGLEHFKQNICQNFHANNGSRT
jgi:hypothetical protein